MPIETGKPGDVDLLEYLAAVLARIVDGYRRCGIDQAVVGLPTQGL